MKKIIIVGFAFISFYSCNNMKNENNMLINKKWYIESLSIKLNGVNIQDEQSLYSAEPCVKDNYDIYKANGKYERNEGEYLCNPNDPAIIEFGTWGLIENDSILLRKNTSKTDTLHVIRLTENELTLQLIETSNNVESIVTFSYKSR